MPGGEFNPSFIEAIWVVVGMLAAGNLYFVKRLVDKIDQALNEISTLREQILILQVTLKLRGEYGRNEETLAE